MVALAEEGVPKCLCTATKIGPREFLTAAHCVTEAATGQPRPAFQPGGRIGVSNLTSPRKRADLVPLTVTALLLHPDYGAGLARFAAYKAERIAHYGREDQEAQREAIQERVRVGPHFTDRFPDIALVQVKEPTPAIATAEVDCRPLAAGELVQLVGYGVGASRRSSGAEGEGPFGTRRWGETTVIRVDAVNFYTYGGLLRAGAVSLAPGDSGGPVLRQGRVVGVHGTVYGLSRRDAGRSNMSVNLHALRGGADPLARVLCLSDGHGDGLPAGDVRGMSNRAGRPTSMVRGGLLRNEATVAIRPDGATGGATTKRTHRRPERGTGPAVGEPG